MAMVRSLYGALRVYNGPFRWSLSRSMGSLWTSMGHYGSLLVIMELFWDLYGALWGHYEAITGHIGALMGPLGSSMPPEWNCYGVSNKLYGVIMLLLWGHYAALY